jgi:multidrug efflux pump subunit AcrA (membrane-fusion protein)
VGANRVVLSGLRDGEQVVLSPPDSLKDGDPVKLAKSS